MIVSTVTIRATHATATDAEKLERFAELCEELATFNETTVDGWQVEVLAAVEARCVHETLPPLVVGGVTIAQGLRCFNAATDVVNGREVCELHAASALIRRSA